jgi:hypothetical protein
VVELREALVGRFEGDKELDGVSGDDDVACLCKRLALPFRVNVVRDCFESFVLQR